MYLYTILYDLLVCYIYDVLVCYHDIIPDIAKSYQNYELRVGESPTNLKVTSLNAAAQSTSETSLPHSIPPTSIR